jgi:hypothetical protein
VEGATRGWGLLNGGVGVDRVSCGGTGTTRVLTVTEGACEEEEVFGKK